VGAKNLSNEDTVFLKRRIFFLTMWIFIISIDLINRSMEKLLLKCSEKSYSEPSQCRPRAEYSHFIPGGDIMYASSRPVWLMEKF
jgi:hypothetical protein